MQIGDRVAYIGQEFNPRVGQVGRIVVLDNGPGKEVGVEFLRSIGGHDCDGTGDTGFCWYVTRKQVQVVDDEFGA